MSCPNCVPTFSNLWGILDPNCWCLEAKAGNYWAGQVVNGDIQNPPMPPTVGSTLPDGNPIPYVPASEDDANAIIQSITDQQILNWQSQNVDFFKGLNIGSSWVSVVLIGAVVVGAISVLAEKGPRKYGR